MLIFGAKMLKNSLPDKQPEPAKCFSDQALGLLKRTVKAINVTA